VESLVVSSPPLICGLEAILLFSFPFNRGMCLPPSLAAVVTNATDPNLFTTPPSHAGPREPFSRSH